MSDTENSFTEEQRSLNPYLAILETFRDKRIKKARDYVQARFALLCAKQQQFRLINIDRLIPPDTVLDLTLYETLTTPPDKKVEKFSESELRQLSFERYIERWAVSAEFYQRITLANLKKLSKSCTTFVKSISSVMIDAHDVNPEIKDPTLKQVYIDVKEIERFDQLLRYWDSVICQDLLTLRAGDVTLATICHFYGVPRNCFNYYSDPIIEDLILSMIRKDQTLRMLRADVSPKEIRRLLKILGTLSFFQIDEYSSYDRIRSSLIYRPDPETSETAQVTPAEGEADSTTDEPEQEAT